ncbi:CoA transferase [Ottowia thiooxydans]|uniref:CoA transferase n=1 Tax=Ottowia thiooxydans TaxID=219182 RepID=UPI00042221A8|nr:CoA transferase [Ottowia thiooxydans]
MSSTSSIKPLRGVRVVSLALNLPGPAALMRLNAWGARCTKIEPPGRAGVTADPMGQYAPNAYEAMHQGVRVLEADLKSDKGQTALHRELARTDVLLTSFRPSALVKLGLGWRALHARHPQLSLVSIVGAPGERAEEPGHDLTYLAEAGLVPALELPATLFADMAGALMSSEAVLATVLAARASAKGVRQEIALSDAAGWLALPRGWGLTTPKGAVGGAHAGYGVYACKDGRVAVAALEPHFAAALCRVVGLPVPNAKTLLAPATRKAIAGWAAGKTRAQLDALAREHDIPLHTLSKT